MHCHRCLQVQMNLLHKGTGGQQLLQVCIRLVDDLTLILEFVSSLMRATSLDQHRSFCRATRQQQAIRFRTRNAAIQHVSLYFLCFCETDSNPGKFFS